MYILACRILYPALPVMKGHFAAVNEDQVHSIASARLACKSAVHTNARFLGDLLANREVQMSLPKQKKEGDFKGAVDGFLTGQYWLVC